MLEFWPNRGNLLHKLAKKRHGGRTVVQLHIAPDTMCTLSTMQRYGDSKQIPRNLSDSSPTYVDNCLNLRQIAKIAPKIVQKNVQWTVS